MFASLHDNPNGSNETATTINTSLIPPNPEIAPDAAIVDAVENKNANDAAADDTHVKTNITSQTRKRPPQRVSWDDRLAMFRAFREQHGHLLIPIRYKPNPSLGKFVHNTREQYKLFHHQVGYKKKCSLTLERIEQLNDLGFVWSTERKKRQMEDWDKRYEQLKLYKAKQGVRVMYEYRRGVQGKRSDILFLLLGLFGATRVSRRSSKCGQGVFGIHCVRSKTHCASLLLLLLLLLHVPSFGRALPNGSIVSGLHLPNTMTKKNRHPSRSGMLCGRNDARN